MEAWKDGKATILQHIAEVYDSIGAKLATELDEATTIRVSRLDWETIKQQSARSATLQLDNARLILELETCRKAMQRAEQLEQDNRRRQSELESALKLRKTSESTKSNTPSGSPKTTPLPPNPPSTSREEPQTTTKTVSGERFNELATRSNRLYDNWQHEKSKKEQWRDKCVRQKDILAQWERIVEEQKALIRKKDGIIKTLRDGQVAVGSVIRDDLDTINQILPPPASTAPIEASVTSHRLDRLATDALPTVTDAEVIDGAEILAPLFNQAESQTKKTTSRDEPANYPDAEFQADRTGIGSVMVIEDSQDQDSIEQELSLPELPSVRPPPVFSDNQPSSTTDNDTSARLNASPRADIAVGNGDVLDENPEFVSATQVKKKRRRKQTLNASPKRKIKVEISSSPSRVGRKLDSSDSVDLDEIGQKTDTPRKQRRLLELARARRAISDDSQYPRTASQKWAFGCMRVTSEQVSEETPTRQSRRKRSALQPLSTNKQVNLKSDPPKASKRRRITSDEAISDVIEDGEMEYQLLHPNPGRGDLLTSLLTKSPAAKIVLSPVRQLRTLTSSESTSLRSVRLVNNDNQTGIGRESPAQGMGLQSSQLEQSLASQERHYKQWNSSISISNLGPAHIGDTTEDSGRTWLSALPAAPEMLADARIDKSPSTIIQTPAARVQNPEIPGHNLVPTSNNVSKSKQRSLETSMSRTREFDPEQQPLRLRPLASLRLEDFKINPSYNQGYNYAFGEVVRDRNDRQHLQGCTHPGCCGEMFRTLAIASRNPHVQLTASQEQCDKELLEEYLGDNYYKVRNMTDSDREEVLLQARTRDLANKHGKHRHAYERPASPPGFWRADFPTTQEDRQDRSRVEEANRVQIRQRYEEAMRPNGRYLFRDE